MKTAIITGAGSGIGAATAYQLEKEGYQLLLVGRTESKLKSTLDNLKEDYHQILPVDITDQTAVRAGYEQFLTGKDVHAIFANAGIGGENHYGEEDRWDTILNINLTGTYYSVQEAIPYLKQSSSPVKHILMTSSCLARFGVPNYTAYCTSKAGLLGLAKSMSLELSQDQILVNALCPGWVETEMAQAGIQKLADHQGVDYKSAYSEQMG
ncbi:MAG: SDR family oxidoreductase [Flavobacteriales bacterium]|nr:SDR family oxidoreductase [Flavobacteriales bacterium]